MEQAKSADPSSEFPRLLQAHVLRVQAGHNNKQVERNQRMGFPEGRGKKNKQDGETTNSLSAK